MKVKVYGPKRSGTNLLAYALHAAGYETMVNEAAWKHGDPEDVGADLHVCILKHPVNWYCSVRRYADPVPEVGQTIHDWSNLAARYMLKAAENPQRWIVILYEDLISKWDQTLAAIAGRLPNPRPWPKKPEGRMNRASGAADAVPEGAKMHDDPYLDGTYWKTVSPWEENYIRESMGPVAKLWYQDYPNLRHRQADRPVVNMLCNHSGIGDILMGVRVRDGLVAAGGYHVNFYCHNPQFASLFIPDAMPIVRGRLVPADVIPVDRPTQGAEDSYTQEALKAYRTFAPPSLRPDFQPLILPTTARNLPDTSCEGEKRTVLFPFAAWRIREWPLENWRKLVEILMRKGHHVVICASEQKLKEANTLGGHEHVIGQDQDVMVATVKRADLIVCNDSGPLHVAGQLGVPVVGVHAVFDKNILGKEYENYYSPEVPMECADCRFLPEKGYVDSKCQPDPDQPKYADSLPLGYLRGCPALRAITPEAVAETIQHAYASKRTTS